MYRLSLVLMLFIFFITGCSQLTDSIQGQIDSTKHNKLFINCSDAVNSGKVNVNAIGYLCSISYTNETIIKDVNGKSVAVDDLLPGAEVSVLLSKSINLKKELSSSLPAKEITLIQPAIQVEPYEVNRSEIIGATIYLGGYINGTGEILTNIEDEQTLDQLSDILQHSPSFRGNITSDWNYTIVLTFKDGKQGEIEIVGNVNVFTDNSKAHSYSLDKERFMDFINSIN